MALPDGQADARKRFAEARVARLATVTPRGAPHIVPVTFALDTDSETDAGTIWWLVDDKPKRSRELVRLANIAVEPRVSLLVDHYDDDWDALWWVRADGVASTTTDEREVERALALLAARYEAYRRSPPGGPVVRVDVRRWRWWSAVRPASSG